MAILKEGPQLNLKCPPFFSAHHTQPYSYQTDWGSALASGDAGVLLVDPLLLASSSLGGGGGQSVLGGLGGALIV